jgi:hypothetical protein
MAKKKALFVKVTSHLTECGVAYDRKFLSLAPFYLTKFAERDKDVKKRVDIKIMLFDVLLNDEDILTKIWEEQPELLAFSAYLTEFENTVALCRKLGYIMPGIPQIIGGPCVLEPIKFLKTNRFVDIVAEGEGELVFRELMRRFALGENLNGVPGTTFRDGRKIVRIPPSGQQVDLHTIPDVIDEEFVKGCSGIAIMETSRGCPNKCKFCGIGTTSMRAYPMERAEKELSVILANPDIRRIFIGDADFFTNKKRTLHLLDVIKKHNKHKTQIELYADFLHIDEVLLRQARAAYVDDTLRIPIQSIQRKALLTSGRHWFNLENLRKNLPVVMRHFPSTRVELIVGLPDDNYQGIKDSFRWCLSNGIRFVRAHRLSNLPNSEYSQNPKKYGLVGDERPPHRVYQSRGFPYSQIYRAEVLSLNYQVVVSFLDTFDYHALRNLGIDIIEVCEELHKIPGWKSQAYVPDEEANILESRPQAIPLITGYLKDNFKLSNNSSDFLSELFRYRHTALSLYNNFKREVLYNPEIHPKAFKGGIPFVPFYSDIETNFDLLSYENGESTIDKPIIRKMTITLMYSYSMNKVIAMEVKSPQLMRQVLQGIPGCGDASNYNSKATADFVERLKKQGFVFYSKSEKLAKTTQMPIISV